MRTLTTLLILFCIPILAQDKPKDVKLSGVKVVERLQQIEKAIQERQKKVISEDPECQRLEFLYRGLSMAFDSTLAVKDTVQVKKK